MRIFLLLVIAAAWAFAVPSASAGSVTFNGDISSILYRNCSECHRPGEAAPFSLLSYQDAVKKGKTMAKVVGSRVMPPWKAEPASYPYRDERRLPDADIALIQKWVDAGMPEGSGPKPTPPKFTSSWRLGEPDLVVTMPTPYHLRADGPDIYRNIALPLGLTEDKWVAAIDLRPSARAAVHHVLYFADSSGRAHEKITPGGEPGFNGMAAGRASIPLGGWAIGAQPHRIPHGFALNLPKKSDLIVQYHFHPTGKPEAEQSVIGLYFATNAPERTLTRIQLPPSYSLFSGLDIPAGEKDFIIRDTYTLPIGIDAIGIGAHAHYICKQLKMTATLPDGASKTLLWIKDWDFAWQDRYYFRDLVSLPKGTRLDAEIHWDNSSENPHNPSTPPKRVTWGEESKDEMGSVSLMVVAHDPSDFAELQTNLKQRVGEAARSAIRADPALAGRLLQFLAE